MSSISQFIIFWLLSGLFLSISGSIICDGIGIFKNIKYIYLTLLSSIFGLLLIPAGYYILFADFIKEYKREKLNK